MRQASSQTRYSSLQTPVTSEDLTGVPPSLLQHVLVDQLDCINPVLAPPLPILIGWNSSKMSRHSNAMYYYEPWCVWPVTVAVAGLWRGVGGLGAGCEAPPPPEPPGGQPPLGDVGARPQVLHPRGPAPACRPAAVRASGGPRDRDESWGFRVTITCKLSLFI